MNRVSTASSNYDKGDATAFPLQEADPSIVVAQVTRSNGIGGTYNKTDTYQFAVGGRYDVGPLRLTADLARTRSKFKGSTASIDYRVMGKANHFFNDDIDDLCGHMHDHLNRAGGGRSMAAGLIKAA